MNTYAKRTQENKNLSIANQLAYKQYSNSSTYQFVDNRPETITNRKLQEIANNRTVSGPEQVVQRAVYDSATYIPNQGANAIANLEAEIGNAENEARDRVQHNHPYQHTPNSAIELTYINNPNNMYWGTCVEHILNASNVGQQWNQNNLGYGANPDYMRVINGRTVWVDLTSQNQSGIGAPHISAKLATMRKNGAPGYQQWEAADITHASLNPYIKKKVKDTFFP
ncbi:MAG: hypothetical protein FH748_13595 [Balneolaceae bacterium]|nr:hypothetical protein [Balneolaceae bacterium]